MIVPKAPTVAAPMATRLAPGDEALGGSLIRAIVGSVLLGVIVANDGGAID